MERLKSCSTCEVEKESSEFYISKISKDGLSSQCRECVRKGCNKWNRDNAEKRKAKRIENYAADPEKYKAKSAEWIRENPDKHKNGELRRRYSITIEQYNQMLAEQNHECAICHTHQDNLKKSLAVDHCHETGKVRGLLCSHCNRAIGALKDDIVILQSAIDYLKKT